MKKRSPPFITDLGKKRKEIISQIILERSKLICGRDFRNKSEALF